MITIEQKVEQFRRMVLGHAQHALEEKIALLDQNDIKALEAMKQELEALGAKHIDEHITLATQERKRQLAKAKLEKSHTLLKEKENFVEDIIIDIEQFARELTQKESYKDEMMRKLSVCIKDLKIEDHIILYLTESDFAFKDEIQAKFGSYKALNIVKADVDFIGGFIMESEATGVRFDQSYKSRIEYSYLVRGGRIFELLHEEGNKHE